MSAPVPEEFSGLTPHITVANADEAIAFYRQAFGADEFRRAYGPDGRMWHVELLIAGSRIFLLEEYPEMGMVAPRTLGGASVLLHLFVPDADEVYNRAVAAGATSLMEPWDSFWGDRYSQVEDPSGHRWAIASRQEDLAHDQIAERADEYLARNPNAPLTWD